MVTLTSLTQIFNSVKPVIWYFHISRNKTIHSLMIHSKTKIHNWFPYIMFTNLRKTYPERMLRNMTKGLINMGQHMEINPLVIIVIWYQLLCFSTQIHLKVCWRIMELQRWVALTIIWCCSTWQNYEGKWYYDNYFARCSMYHFPSNKYCYINTYC